MQPLTTHNNIEPAIGVSLSSDDGDPTVEHTGPALTSDTSSPTEAVANGYQSGTASGHPTTSNKGYSTTSEGHGLLTDEHDDDALTAPALTNQEQLNELVDGRSRSQIICPLSQSAVEHRFSHQIVRRYGCDDNVSILNLYMWVCL